MLRDLRFRLRALVRRGRAEDDLDDELHFHLDRAVEQHVARGLSVAEARRRARLDFGPVDAVKDDSRQSWGIRQLDILRRDLVSALRLIRKHPALSAIAAVSLAIGIGLNTALFALVDATLLRRLPVERPERLVDVYANDTDGFAWHGSSYPDYLDLRDGARALTGLMGYVPAMAAVRSGGDSRMRPGEVVTGDYFRVLGVPVALGRALSPDDDRPGAAPVVVISAAFWSSVFDADPGAVGRTLRIGGRPYTVVGVAPFPGMNAPMLTPDFWVPLARVDDVQPIAPQTTRRSPGATPLERRGTRWLLLKGRLREGESAGTAAADLNRVMGALEAAYPGSNEGFRVTVVPTGEVATHPMVEDRLRAGAASLVVLMGLVLLIVCANVAGLLLERASARRREIGLLLALGATRARLVRQLLAESAVLSLLGAAAGAVLAWGLLQGLGVVRAPLLVPVALDLSLNGRVLGLSVAAALGAGIAAGLMPAWTGTRSSVLGGLAAGGSAWSIGGGRWRSEALVTVQIAVSLVILVMAGLLARNLAVAGRADPGFSPDAIAAVTVGLGLVGYDDDEAARFLERARDRVRALPGVQAVARATRAPLSVNYMRTGVAPAEGTEPDAAFVPVETAVVGAGYFDALGVPVLAGRRFDDAVDTADSPPVAIVNDAFASRFWPEGSAVGRRIRSGLAGSPIEIVGVVRDYRVRSLREPPTPYVHFAASQQPGINVSATVLLARTRGDAGALAVAMQRELRRIDPDVVFWEGLTLRDNVATQLLPLRLLSAMLGAAGVVAVWLAALGLYGVIAHAVARRTREIGIRMALGATPRDVLGLVVRQGAVPVGIGAAVGLALAFAAARATAGVLFGIDAGDPLAWGAAVVTLAVVGGLAHALPARRAVRVAPAAALRVE